MIRFVAILVLVFWSVPVRADAYTDGLAALKSKDYPAARRFLEEAAARNHPRAIEKLGEMHLKGWGVPKDAPKAVEYLARAADLDVMTAMHSLGLVYLRGRPGVPKDVAKAEHWIRRAAEEGLLRARDDLAKHFDDRPPNFRRTARYLAARVGNWRVHRENDPSDATFLFCTAEAPSFGGVTLTLIRGTGDQGLGTLHLFKREWPAEPVTREVETRFADGSEAKVTLHRDHDTTLVFGGLKDNAAFSRGFYGTHRMEMSIDGARHSFAIGEAINLGPVMRDCVARGVEAGKAAAAEKAARPTAPERAAMALGDKVLAQAGVKDATVEAPRAGHLFEDALFSWGTKEGVIGAVTVIDAEGDPKIEILKVFAEGPCTGVGLPPLGSTALRNETASGDCKARDPYAIAVTVLMGEVGLLVGTYSRPKDKNAALRVHLKVAETVAAMMQDGRFDNAAIEAASR